jgi:hypothetical protein
LDVKRFSRAADSYWRLRAALKTDDRPISKIERPKGMQTRAYASKLEQLAKCEAVIMRELMSIKTGRV